MACSAFPARSCRWRSSAVGRRSDHERILLDPVEVAFHKNWDPNSSQRNPSRRLSKDDMEAIKTDLASELRKVFGETLGKSGYPPVDEDDDGVLRVTAVIWTCASGRRIRCPQDGRVHTARIPAARRRESKCATP